LQQVTCQRVPCKLRASRAPSHDSGSRPSSRPAALSFSGSRFCRSTGAMHTTRRSCCTRAS
jgi:hypothetical protein